MKKIMHYIITLLLVTFIVGCSSTSNYAVKDSQYKDSSLDIEKIAAVEYAAEKRGTQVIWVHKPEKIK